MMSLKERQWRAHVRDPYKVETAACASMDDDTIRKLVRQYVQVPMPKTIDKYELRTVAIRLNLLAEPQCANLPIDVVCLILDKALDAGLTMESLRLIYASRAMMDRCISDASIMTKLLKTVRVEPKPDSPHSLMKQFAFAFSKYTQSCVFCKARGLRRVYYDLGGFCACKFCLRQNTILQYTLQKEYMFDMSTMERRLPYYVKEFYAGKWRSATLHISLVTDAEKLCQELFGMTLSERRLEVVGIRAAQASARAAVYRERARDRRSRESAIKRLCKACGITRLEELPSFKKMCSKHTGVPSDEVFMQEAVPVIRAEHEHMVAVTAAIQAWIETKADADVARCIFITKKGSLGWFYEEAASVQHMQMLYERVVAVPIVAKLLPPEEQENFIARRLSDLHWTHCPMDLRGRSGQQLEELEAEAAVYRLRRR